jgi:hypothetical protein
MSPSQPWVKYSQTPFSVPEHMGINSKGFATAQKLLKMGFTYV